MKRFDTFDRPEGWSSPAAAFAQDFAAGHRIQTAPWGGYAILGHRELLRLSRDPLADGMAPDPASFAEAPSVHDLLSRALFTKAGEAHRFERAAMIAAFNAISVDEITREVVGSLVPPSGAVVDLRTGLVDPVVRSVWASIIGLDDADARRLAAAVGELGYLLSPAPQTDKAHISERAAREVARLSRKAVESGAGFCRALRGGVPIDLAADLVAGVAVDAIETAATGLDAAIRVAIANRPRVEATGRCANECLRMASPTPFTMRVSRGPIVIDDLDIGPGEVLTMVWAAANQDPSVFPAPERFDPDRAAARPLTFGMGQHACLGHALMRATLVALLRLLDRLQPVGDPPEQRWRPLSKDWLPAMPLRVLD